MKSAPGSRASSPAPPERSAPLGWGALALALSTLFLGFDIGSHPIVLWDESRTLANALEMDRTGLSLVTTYEGQPDLWLTKPPLAVWLAVLCIRLFGASLWAMRLPSLLSAVGTVALTLAFAWRISRSRFVTFTAIVLLLFSFGFYGYHAAWTAECDALLGLLSTAYILGLFKALHSSRPKAVLVLGCALAVALACLAKGVAGLMPGIGIAVYVLVRGRAQRLVRTPWYGLGAMLFIVLVGGFYFLRERAAPGFFAAMMHYEVGDRFVQGIGENRRPFYFYLEMLPVLFSVPPALLALVAAPWLKWPNTRAKTFLIYGAYVCGGLILVLSLSSTKSFWYLVPIYPILSIITAIALDQAGVVLSERGGISIGKGSLLIAAAAFAIIAVGVKLKVLPEFTAVREGGYGQVFSDVAKAGLRRVVVLESGERNKEEGRDAYAPILHDYMLMWRDRGFDIRRVMTVADATAGPRTVIASCDARFVPVLRGSRGVQLTRARGCSAVFVPVTETKGSPPSQ